jgi:hypothetical protein
MALRLKLGGDVPQRALAPVDRIARPRTVQAFRAHSGGRAYQGNWAGRNELALEENAMLKMFALIGVGTAIAFTPLPTIAQTAPEASAGAATAPTGSHQSQMRHRANTSKERARASAHHMHHMRHNSAPTP